MFPKHLTVEGGNPDDLLTDRSHLKLVVSPTTIAEPAIPAQATAHSVVLRIIDGVTTAISYLRLQLEFVRERLQKEEAAACSDPDRQIGGRGW